MLTGNIVVPRLCFLNVARSTASDLYAHNMLWINSFTLSSSPDYKKNNKTPKPDYSLPAHIILSQWIFILQNWKHTFCVKAPWQQVYGDIIIYHGKIQWLSSFENPCPILSNRYDPWMAWHDSYDQYRSWNNGSRVVQLVNCIDIYMLMISNSAEYSLFSKHESRKFL